MKVLKTIILFSLFFFIVGCSYYTITTESLVKQLKENQIIKKDFYYHNFSLINYPSNNLNKIKCLDSDGYEVWLFPDKNTEFKFIRKSDGEVFRAYFDTVIFQNDTIFGLRSRLLGGIRIIPASDIDKIEISAEFPKTEPVIKYK